MKSPIITVIGSLSFASGCLAAALNADQLAGSRALTSTVSQFPDAPLILNQLLTCLVLTWPFLLLMSLTGFTIAIIAEKKALAIVLILLPLVAALYALWRLPRPEPTDLWFEQHAGNIECICKIESIKRSNSLICSAISMHYPWRRSLSGKTLVTIYDTKWKPTFAEGQTIVVAGRISPLGQSAASWQRDDRKSLAPTGIFTKIATDRHGVKLLPDSSRQAESEQPTVWNSVKTNWQNFWQTGREEIIKAHANSLGGEKGDLLSSMVLGDRVVQLPKELRDLFRNVGLSHLLAASGFNLSIVVASSYFIARLLPVSPTYAILAALTSTASFVCLAGPSPSVVRAAMLCVFFLSAKFCARNLHSLAALSLTLTVAALADPLCVKDVGLQLSYVATAGIICGLHWVKQPPPKSVVERLKRWFTDTVSVICIAQLSVLPIQLLYFQNTGLLFLPANLLIDPVVAPVTVLGFISSMLAFGFSFVPGSITYGGTIISWIDKLTSLSLDYMLHCTRTLASIEGTTIRMGPPVPFAIPVYFLCMSYFLYELPRRKSRGFGLVVLLIGLCVLLFRPNIPGEILYLSKKSALSIETRSAVCLNNKEPDWHGKHVLTHCGLDNQPRNIKNENEIARFEVTLRAKRNVLAPKPASVSLRETRDFIIVSQHDENDDTGQPLELNALFPTLDKLKHSEHAHQELADRERADRESNYRERANSERDDKERDDSEREDRERANRERDDREREDKERDDSKRANSERANSERVKPILVWVKGRSPLIRQARGFTNVYIAYTSSSSTILIAKNHRASRSQETTTTETRNSASRHERSSWNGHAPRNAFHHRGTSGFEHERTRVREDTQAPTFVLAHTGKLFYPFTIKGEIGDLLILQ